MFVAASPCAKVGTSNIRPAPIIITTTNEIASPSVSTLSRLSGATASPVAMVKPAMAATKSGTKEKPMASLTHASNSGADCLNNVQATTTGAMAINTANMILAADRTMMVIVAMAAATRNMTTLVMAPASQPPFWLIACPTFRAWE